VLPDGPKGAVMNVAIFPATEFMVALTLLNPPPPGEIAIVCQEHPVQRRTDKAALVAGVVRCSDHHIRYIIDEGSRKLVSLKLLQS